MKRIVEDASKTENNQKEADALLCPCFGWANPSTPPLPVIEMVSMNTQSHLFPFG